MPRPRRSAHGFTIVEMLFVVTLILTITVLAFPSLKTFTARDQDASIATFLTHEFNQVKALAQMRNRAYIVEFAEFDANEPRGRVDIYEGNLPSCTETMADLGANARRLARYGLGGTPIPGQPGWDDPPGGVEPLVGLTGWIPVGGNPAVPERGNPLVLCARPDGAVADMGAGAGGPLTGQVRLLVQRFTANGPVGPARRLRFDFSSPARLELL